MRSPSRILYVDDDKDSCELARIMLSYSGIDCTVISAESSEEALFLIEKESFDLYIFDYVMPEISGVELCRRVRQFDSNTPVLFFSGMARPIDIKEGIEAGANEYLIKPNDLEKLSVTVKRLLDKTSLDLSHQSIIKTRIDIQPDDIQPETSSEQVLQSGKVQPLTGKDAFYNSRLNSLKKYSKRIPEIYHKIREKKFNQNQLQIDKVRKLRAQPVITGAAIFAIIVVHFVSQTSFFQNENFISKQNSPKIENEQSTETKTQYEAKSLDVKPMPDKATLKTAPEKATPSVSPKPKIVPSNAVIKKREPGESKAERLRRAERILTGV